MPDQIPDGNRGLRTMSNRPSLGDRLQDRPRKARKDRKKKERGTRVCITRCGVRAVSCLEGFPATSLSWDNEMENTKRQVKFHNCPEKRHPKPRRFQHKLDGGGIQQILHLTSSGARVRRRTSHLRKSAAIEVIREHPRGEGGGDEDKLLQELGIVSTRILRPDRQILESINTGPGLCEKEGLQKGRGAGKKRKWLKDTPEHSWEQTETET